MQSTATKQLMNVCADVSRQTGVKIMCIVHVPESQVLMIRHGDRFNITCPQGETVVFDSFSSEASSAPLSSLNFHFVSGSHVLKPSHFVEPPRRPASFASILMRETPSPVTTSKDDEDSLWAEIDRQTKINEALALEIEAERSLPNLAHLRAVAGRYLQSPMHMSNLLLDPASSNETVVAARLQ